MNKSDLQSWLNYLETLDPHKIKLGLERVAQVAHKQQLQKFSCPVITVTGTNGKGSCVAFLEAIFLAAGYRVGAYTSPHLFHFNERIRLQGKEVDDAALISAFTAIENLRAEILLTYFEFATLAALQIFQQENLDVLILEVGLGGRLDAVNIVDANIAVISSIGIDHQAWLGNTRESIAQEKAGIFRESGVAVCGDSDPPNNLKTIAQSLNTKLYIAQRDFNFTRLQNDWCWQTADQQWQQLPLLQLDYQNAATALMCIHLLKKLLPVSFAALKSGLKNAVLPGRFQQFGAYILDVAHNPHAAHWLAHKLAQTAVVGRSFAVVGMLNDKDHAGTLSEMQQIIDEWHVTDLNCIRSASAANLLQTLTEINIKNCYNHASVSDALAAVQSKYQEGDRVVIFGSFYTVAAALEELGAEKANSGAQ